MVDAELARTIFICGGFAVSCLGVALGSGALFAAYFREQNMRSIRLAQAGQRLIDAQRAEEAQQLEPTK